MSSTAALPIAADDLAWLAHHPSVQLRVIPTSAWRLDLVETKRHRHGTATPG